MDHLKQGVYNRVAKREVYLFGDDHACMLAKAQIENLPVIQVMHPKHFETPKNSTYFLVAVADFTKQASLYSIVERFSEVTDPNLHKILYVNKPDQVQQEHLFFGAEIGARFVVSGPDRDQNLREYIKRIVVEVERLGSVTFFESEIARLTKRHDRDGLLALDDRLSEIDRNTEEIMRLRVLVNQRLNRLPRVITFLKKVLAINPQNLWAANELGRMFIRQGDVAEGVKTLEKLSKFHELNAERFLTIGEVYLNCGRPDEAAVSLKKSEAVGADSERLGAAKAKLSILKSETRAVAATMPYKQLSPEVVAFMNMRAIMAVRAGDAKRALQLYREAIEFAPDDDLIKSKLNFNCGLGLIRSEKPEEAIQCFERSLELGGKSFARAAAPLDISRRIVKNKVHAAEAFGDLDLEFEEIGNKAS